MRTLVCVSGGDAPGINTLIARLSVLAAGNGDVVLGAAGGFAGIFDEQIDVVDRRIVRRLDGRGGTLYASTREPVLAAEDAGERLKAILKKHKIDNIVLFGGNGSLTHIPVLLKQWGIPHIGIPTTIDNDIAGTEYTLGFDSACNYAYQAIDGVIGTAHALRGRIFMVETLGGDTGYLALAIAHGAGAHLVLLPEYDFTDVWLGERLKDAIAREHHALVVLSEGVKAIPRFPELIPDLTGVRLRYTRLGHAQRAGAVTHRDRVFAGQCAVMAYEALRSDIQSGIIVVRGNTPQVLDYHPADIELALPDQALYQTINGLDA